MPVLSCHLAFQGFADAPHRRLYVEASDAIDATDSQIARRAMVRSLMESRRTEDEEGKGEPDARDRIVARLADLQGGAPRVQTGAAPAEPVAAIEPVPAKTKKR